MTTGCLAHHNSESYNLSMPIFLQRLFRHFANAERLMAIFDGAGAVGQLCRCSGIKELTARKMKQSWDKKRGGHCAQLLLQGPTRAATLHALAVRDLFELTAPVSRCTHNIIIRLRVCSNAGLLDEARAAAAAAAESPLVAAAAEEVPTEAAEAADATAWDEHTRCYAPDMYRAETVRLRSNQIKTLRGQAACMPPFQQCIGKDSGKADGPDHLPCEETLSTACCNASQSKVT